MNSFITNHLKLLIMKKSRNFKTILFAACFALLLPTTSQAQEEENFLLNLTEFTVKFNHGTNFTDGVKKWNKCYKDNGGKDTWNVWHRLQGKGNVYTVASRMDNWAAMDVSDPAGKACRAIALDFITPHIESREDNIASNMPKYSRTASMEGISIAWVTSFKVTNSVSFNEVISEVTSVVGTKEGDKRGYWYNVMGGEGATHFVTTPFKNFADIDVERDGIWTAYESVKGKAKTKEMREKIAASFDEIWSYVYTLEEDLSIN